MILGDDSGNLGMQSLFPSYILVIWKNPNDEHIPIPFIAPKPHK